MIDIKTALNQIPFTLENIELPTGISSDNTCPRFTTYRGKVRDSIILKDRRILITTDRLSAFDVVLTTIPFKGQVLNEIANFWFKDTATIVPNHVIATPHPNVLVCREVEVLPIEIVVRGYLTGSAWRDYQGGKAISGITLPKGLTKSCRFDQPLITPSTKAEKGKHDEPISQEEIISQGLVPESIWNEVCKKALVMFDYGSKRAHERDLILVDTKYEFGILKNSDGSSEVILADEVHTPDSSRYWIESTYESRLAAGDEPEMLDKEFVRSELISLGFMGNGTPPILSEEFRAQTALRYIDLYERMTGQTFVPRLGNIQNEINQVLLELLS